MRLSRLASWFLLPGLLFSACGGRPCPTPDPAGHDLVYVGHAPADRCAPVVVLDARIATGDPESPTWSPAAAAPVELLGAWPQVAGSSGAGLKRPVSVRNRGAAPVTLVGIEWSTPADGLRVEGAELVLHNGYQSWSYTGFERIPQAALEEQHGTAARGGDNEEIAGEKPGVSWWWTAIADRARLLLVAGALRATVLKTYLAVDAAPAPRLRVIMGMTGDAIPLAPGETRELDPIYLDLGGAAAPPSLDAYATAVAGMHTPLSRRAPLGGWGSWNLYYDKPDAASIRAEAAWAAKVLVPAHLPDFLLDDGYEPRWGDWRADPKFGADLATLNAEQAAAGLRPALWIAPFYVAVEDPVVTQHPDWFVHRPGGALRTYNNIGPTYAALDVTSDGARDFLVKQIRALRDAGEKTLKIDFLFGGAIEGVRQRNVTSLESYALWMKAIREAAPDLHLVGCGAPLLPSVGRVDSMRIGADIAFAPQPEPRYAFIAASARNTIHRAFTDQLWALDPDVVLLRGAHITDAEAWTTVVASAMAGGNYLLGDGRQASAVRAAMALDPEVLAIAREPGAARAADPTIVEDERVLLSPLLDPGGATQYPHRWVKTSALLRTTWTALFGGPDGFTGEAPAQAVELLPPTDKRPVTAAPVAAGPITVAPHAVRLFRAM